MIKKVLLIGAFGVVVGILIYSFIGAIPLVSMLQPLLTRVQDAWATIPKAMQGIILALFGGIPTIIATFMAWTKIRAMNQLQETKLQASQQITQLEGEKGMLEQQVKQSTTEGIEDLVKARDTALQSRDEAQTLVTTTQQQMRDMQNRHLGEMASLQARLDKYEPKERVVIK